MRERRTFPKWQGRPRREQPKMRSYLRKWICCRNNQMRKLLACGVFNFGRQFCRRTTFGINRKRQESFHGQSQNHTGERKMKELAIIYILLWLALFGLTECVKDCVKECVKECVQETIAQSSTGEQNK